MACLRGFAVLLLVLVHACLVCCDARKNCASMFKKNGESVTGVNDVATVKISVDELTPEQEVLYTLSWEAECVDPPPILDATFNDYFTVNDTDDCGWEVSVRKDLKGLPDYNPESQDTIQTTVWFEGFTTIDFERCQVTLLHNIDDANNRVPEPTPENDVVKIKENFPLNYAIDDLMTSVQDKDGAKPNNQFIVITDDNCPLEATGSTYDSGASAASVAYRLRHSLEYESENKEIKCDIFFTDLGPEPQTGTAAITVMVQDVPDEPPVFSHAFYYSTVTSTSTSGEALDVMPSEIKAVDGDTGINETITYTMTDAKPGVGGMNYFTMNEITGEVTIKEELDDTFLLNEEVIFSVTAEDTSGAQSSVMFKVRLHYLVCSGLHFERAHYAAEIFQQSVGQVLRVVALGSPDKLEYSLREDSEFFDIDPNTGSITVREDNPPPEGIYQLKAVATVKAAPSEDATAIVNIHVLPLSSDKVEILTSIITETVMEGEAEADVAVIKLSKPAGNVCKIRAQPLPAHASFGLTRQDDTTWKLRKTGVLDYKVTPQVTLIIEAFEESVNCPEVTDENMSTLLRSQSVAVINVRPVLSSQDMVVAYPTNEGLRRAVGPVVSFQTVDRVTYSVKGPDAAQFTLDDEAGEVYVVKGFDCDPECNFVVEASDGDNLGQLNVKVLPLDMGHVFTFLMSDTPVSEVDAALAQMSQDVGARISKLYVSPTQPGEAQRGASRQKRDAQISLEVHVYSIKGGVLMSRDDLNSALEDSTLEAQEFTDGVVFAAATGGSDNTEGLTVAVAVLGSLLGLVLLAGIGLFVYQRKKKGEVTSKKPRPPSPITTLGNAYQNHSYEKEGPMMQGSLGHKTNGSLNGFTSVQVHSSQDRDSPPMNRSPLAFPSDTIQLTNMDTNPQQQQSGGLRRTNPSAPEYYGSSTPAPPPSFIRTTALSAAPPEPSSSSSSYPIYAEIKKPKDGKAKSSASASTSSSKPEKAAPRSVDKKPAEPSADYEEVGHSKFSALKASPPPRRSKNHNADDDDEEDIKEGVAYPGGKGDKDEDASQDERKSVAFKVMVDTKEIEAENKGPAQRKAEAEMLMEANRKKLEEDSEEEEENAKL